MKKALFIIVSLLTTLSIAQCPLTDQTVNTADFSSPCSADTTVEIASSQIGVNYYLRDDFDDSIIDGPIAGTGSAISFSTGNIIATTTYNIYGSFPPIDFALNFDATDDIVDIPVSLGSEDSVSIEAWINSNGGVTNQGIIGQMVGGNQFEFFRNGSGFLEATFYSAGGSQSAQSMFALIPGNWYHVVATYDGIETRLYMDGSDVTTSQSGTGSGALLSSGAQTTIGLTDATEYFDGEIDQLSIWNKVRSGTEITNASTTCPDGTEANLIAHYSFSDGPSSSTLFDVSVNANHGTLTNMDPANDWVTGMSCPGCVLEMTDLITITITTLVNSVTASGGDLTATESGAGVTYQWIDCSDSSDVVGQTSQTFTPTANGDYAVILSANGCTDTSACTTVSGIGFDENYSPIFFSVYPNPSNGEIFIQTEGSASSFVIYDLVGQVVLTDKITSNLTSVNLRQFGSTVYVIQLNTEQGPIQKRIVVK